MSTRERTRQQLDPIGTFGNGLTTVLLAASAFVFAAVTTYEVLDQIESASLAIVALLALGISCVIVVFAASPYRAPFTRRTHDLVLVLALIAVVVHALADGHEHGFIRNDWCPAALGLLLLAMGPYRPARELVVATSMVAIIVGFITVLQRPVVDGLPVVAVVAVTVMPILALGYASAANAHRVVSGLEQWQAKIMRPDRVVSRQDEDGIARSVQQDRITILNREVLPFFLEIIDKPAVSNGDRERALDIASSIRGVMVAEVDRSWLDTALEKAASQRRPRPAGAVPLRQELRDDEHVAGLMTYDQRTALRAFIGALHDLPSTGPEFIKIELFRDGLVYRGVIRVSLEMADFTLRSLFAPYFAVLRVMFSELRLEYLQGVLTLSFSYEQR